MCQQTERVWIFFQMSMTVLMFLLCPVESIFITR